MALSKVLQRKMFRDPSQDENVGIMQGFMDDVHEMLGVDDMFDEEPGEEDDGGVAKAMGRRPNSPEILMNNLRGDMRSVDARIEELAEMVGYNAAASTPPEVLALLQPVLKQQGIAALEAAAPAMPDMGMAPPGMPDMAMAPPPAMEGGIGSLPQGNMGQPPVQMARGGPVQYFQTGDEVVAGAVTPVDTRTFSPEVMDMFRQRILRQLNADPTAAAELQPGYLTRRTQELSPEYKALLGVDPGASKGQMLFDVAQAALNYAGNVNPQGQSLRGSQAARLAGAFSGLPGAIGARSAEAQKQNQAIRMAAMQGAQSEIDAARSASISQGDTLDKLAIEAMKNSGSTPRPLSAQDKVDYGITGADANLPWVFNSTGVPVVTGGRLPAPPAAQPTPEQMGMAKYVEKLATELPARSEGSAKIVGMQGNITNLLTLSNTVGEGPINAVMAQLFPNSNSPAAAYNSIVSQMLPQMRPPGSGSQSDKDIDVLRAGFGQLGDSPETRRFVLLTIQQKIDLEREKLTLISRYGLPAEEGGLGLIELNRKLIEIDSKSVMSPELLNALKGVVGPERVNNIYAGTETSVVRTPAEIQAAAAAAAAAQGGVN